MDLDKYLDNLNFSKVNEVKKIIDNGFKIKVENCYDISILKELSSVKDVSQETFDIYLKALKNGIKEKDFFLDESIERKDKERYISLVKLGLDGSLAKLCKHNPSKKDKEYIDLINDTLKKEEITKLLEKGCTLGAISSVANARNNGIDILKYVNFSKYYYDKSTFDSLFEMIKSDEDFDKRNLKFYFSKPFPLWKKIHELDIKGFPIEKLNEKSFNKSCLRQLELLFDKGVDINRYIDKHYNFLQLQEIVSGVDGKLDYKMYDDVNYDYAQMQIIRKALKYNKEHEEKIDVSFICNPKIDKFTMKNIIHILKTGSLDDKLKIMKEYGTKANDDIVVFENLEK